MKTSEAKNTVEKQKNAKELPRHTRGKSHSDRWRRSIYRPIDGRGHQAAEFSVRIMFQKRRVNFPLRTGNRSAAAAKASEIYTYLSANGWEAALAKYKPEPEKPTRFSTVGELIEAAEKVATASPKSVKAYGTKLRTIAAQIAGIEAGRKARYGYKNEAFADWRKRVDGLSLEILTGESVARWRAERVAKEKTPDRRKAARVSADSAIRQAKSFFGKRILPLIKDRLSLPDPLPFDGITLGRTTRRFKAEVNGAALFNAGRVELLNAPSEKWPTLVDKRGRKLPKPKISMKAVKLEQWKAFALIMLAGLRRLEADLLTWSQIDLSTGQIRIEPTAYFSPKTPESERVIDLTPEAVEIIRKFKSMPHVDPVFVLNGGEPRPGIDREYYRADAAPWRTWERLAEWLRGKGITAPAPVHALRKIAGSVINEAFGIEAARDFLGHADVSTTSNSYLAKRPKVAVAFDVGEVAGHGKETGHGS